MIRRLAAIALLLAAAPKARAAGLQIVPVLVELSQAEPRSTVVVRNVTDQPVRLELTAHAWEQAPDGQMKLAPAPEIVVYPPLLQLAPQEERKVRVSTTAPFRGTEQSYRVFLKEMAPAERPGDKPGVRFLTRIGIPVFLMPPRPELRAELVGGAVHDGRVAFTLRNTGNTRLSPAKVKIDGLEPDGKKASTTTVDVWYVLAGGERVFDVRLPTEGCARVRQVAVEVPVGDGAIRARIDAPRGACGP